ncbi:MAG: helix-turn-helix transcriptional regulator [Nitrospiraceae bacterium]|nr:helix-turn-helix transcriptional regulator [Nitrospiraceae bacterium]
MIYRVKFRTDDPELIEVLEKTRRGDLVKKALKHLISRGQGPEAERPARKTICPPFDDGQISARIAYNFRRLRQIKGWTQEDVAARAGVNKSGPAIIESGRSAFSRRAQEKWAKVFEVDVSEFFRPVPGGEKPDRISCNFKRLRELRGWTQDELASYGGVSRDYIARVEAATCGFGLRAQEKWAKVFGVDISEFYKPVTDGEPKIKPTEDPKEAKSAVEPEKEVYDFDRFL